MFYFSFSPIITPDTTTAITVLWPLYSQSALASTYVLRIGGFVGAEFYCPHALVDGNQRIRIREKMPEFFSTVLSTLSP